MNGLNRFSLLKALVAKCGDNAYLGFGNPESNLLILGKECAKRFNPTGEIIDCFSVQHNSKQWKKYLADSVAEIRSWDKVPYDEMEYFFNPRFAFYGQQFHCRRTKKDEKGQVIDNKGTSRTWYFYQKLINMVRGFETMRYGDQLDFQDYCFISDLSDYSKPMSNTGDSQRTNSSIALRAESMFSDPFFQAFPVVLGAFGNYLTKEQLQLLFPQAIVITSRQLSMNFSTSYLVDKSQEIIDALKIKGISL